MAKQTLLQNFSVKEKAREAWRFLTDTFEGYDSPSWIYGFMYGYRECLQDALDKDHTIEAWRILESDLLKAQEISFVNGRKAQERENLFWKCMCFGLFVLAAWTCVSLQRSQVQNRHLREEANKKVRDCFSVITKDKFIAGGR